MFIINQRFKQGAFLSERCSLVCNCNLINTLSLYPTCYKSCFHSHFVSTHFCCCPLKLMCFLLLTCLKSFSSTSVPWEGSFNSAGCLWELGLVLHCIVELNSLYISKNLVSLKSFCYKHGLLRREGTGTKIVHKCPHSCKCTQCSRILVRSYIS